MSAPARLYVPDEELLRRFGLVRAVGGGAYVVAVLVLFAIYGLRMWPLAIGAPVLAVVTTAYFLKSFDYPRASVVASLVADALVLGGVVAFLGGVGSGAAALYAIVVVSAGILLGPASAMAFTGFTIALAVLQLALEELGFDPAVLVRTEPADRLPVLLMTIFLLVSVGYLSGTYADRLHEKIDEGGRHAEALHRRSRRRRSFVEQATVDVRAPLREVEAVADDLDTRWPDLTPGDRRKLAARLRMGAMRLDAEIGLLADVGVLDEVGSGRPEPVLLRRAVEDVVVGLGDRLQGHVVHLDVPPLKVVGHRRALRRVVLNLLENVVEHTPDGTTVHLTALVNGPQAVLVVSDDGPGVPPEAVPTLFEPPDSRHGGGPTVGLPLVHELCERMGARVHYEPVPGGGARFLVSFRLAPSAAPSADEAGEGGQAGQAGPAGEAAEAAQARGRRGAGDATAAEGGAVR